MKKAIYAGSFDPITFGHVDIIERALTIFDRLVIGISINQEKSPIFTLEERKDLVERSFTSETRVEVLLFDGLLVEFARKNRIPVVVRGLRASSDFDYEFQMATMNRLMDNFCETVFLMGSPQSNFLSSRLVKEIALLNGDVTNMVPPHVKVALDKKCDERHG